MGRLIAENLGLAPHEWRLSFQSRFGKAEWLKPYTSEILHGLPAEGVKTLDVMCPGFPADCLETLEEIAMEGKEEFLTAGGSHYRYIACLNDRGPGPDSYVGLAHRKGIGRFAGIATPADPRDRVRRAEVNTHRCLRT
jgi:ferrochelatase